MRNPLAVNPKSAYICDMTIDRVRELLRQACETAGSQSAWAQAHEMTGAYVSDVINGRREPGPKVLRALGLSRVTCYKVEGTK